ncbi:MAG: hypothetical protein K2W97_01875 [Chthoniobacterales bacterium]|nr:hypothetical protein [Chthoniobacterales bacterium]
MKHSPLSVLVLVALILLTFSSEKVFSMYCCWPKKRTFDLTRNEGQARFEKSRTENGSEYKSSVVSRGALGPEKGPSEQKGAKQDDGQDEGEDSYFHAGELSDQEEAFLCLQRIQGKYDEAKMIFERAEILDKAQTLALKMMQREIDVLTVTLERAGQKPLAEQASAFEAALESAEDKEFYLCMHLNKMIEDVQYKASQVGYGTYLSILRDQKERQQVRK